MRNWLLLALVFSSFAFALEASEVDVGLPVDELTLTVVRIDANVRGLEASNAELMRTVLAQNSLLKSEREFSMALIVAAALTSGLVNYWLFNRLNRAREQRAHVVEQGAR
jgi:hypothetical protein